ncbi:hypothetical protein BHE74_00044990 [Ensete ventricosum]|nr:hypothetical protein BHE74_00044990 [Ensete ventricosum]
MNIYYSLLLYLSERLVNLDFLYPGGHTAEMLSIMNVLQNDIYTPRIYVAAATDNMSLKKARVLEESLMHQGEVHTFYVQWPQLKKKFRRAHYVGCLMYRQYYYYYYFSSTVANMFLCIGGTTGGSGRDLHLFLQLASSMFRQ